MGDLLRDWRRTRRLSQLDLSISTGVSARHISFVETGRSRPSPDLILRLAEQLEIPLADRNALLLAGGHAPAYPSHALTDPEMGPVLAAVRHLLDGHDPYPAALIDQHWDLVEANAAIEVFTAGCAPHLLEPPINVLRLSLHPDGMAPRIGNLAEWRAHLLHRLRQQATTTNDPMLYDLLEELSGYPGGTGAAGPTSVVVPLVYQHLSFVSTTTLFGTPLDVTVAGLAIESFFPADSATAERLRAR
ncbi:helix-turn-helix transcriptional regulator [Asanoa iriomotensis]|uniref:Transcriptional regulator n=1 Tax=Asanoa iriomotensis TaxID=234613 RepID=A0ABQ4BXM3_9ACTN|nr:transcriptional regulator [Asanoa iriomotensis]